MRRTALAFLIPVPAAGACHGEDPTPEAAPDTPTGTSEAPADALHSTTPSGLAVRVMDRGDVNAIVIENIEMADVVPDQARAFVEEIGGAGYPLLEGRGDLRARYNYRGLPYTVVLDRQGQIARAFYGFGSSIDPIRAVVESEISGGSGPP